MFSLFFLCCYFCPALPSGGGRLLERADRRLSRQHSQQSLTHSQAQSVSSLTSDLWDRSSAETPGIFPPRLCFLLTAGWTHGPTYVSRLWSTDETNSLSSRRIVHEGHCGVVIVNISQRVSQQQRQSFPRKQKQNRVFNLFALTPLSLSVFLCLSPSSCAPWSVPSGRPDAAAAAVSRLHASDQHVICQICHLSSTLRHHGTLFCNMKVFFGLNLKVFFSLRTKSPKPWNLCVGLFAACLPCAVWLRGSRSRWGLIQGRRRHHQRSAHRRGLDVRHRAENRQVRHAAGKLRRVLQLKRRGRRVCERERRRWSETGLKFTVTSTFSVIKAELVMFFAFQGSFIFSVLWETGKTGDRLLSCSGQF